MTAFARAEKNFEKIKIYIEIKSVNNRYLDVRISASQLYNSFQTEIAKLVREKFCRGNFDVYIRREVLDDSYMSLSYDKVRAKRAFEILSELKQTYSIKSDITFSDFNPFDVYAIRCMPDDNELKYEWDCVKEVMEEALVLLSSMREQEGKHLWKDIVSRLKYIEEEVRQIEKNFKTVLADYTARVQDRLEKVLKQAQKKGAIDDSDPRFQMELGYIAERCDVTEEIIRLNAHLKEFMKLESIQGASGRKMDFFLQEMNREINTIASKNVDKNLGRQVIEIKSEIEKIRQQVQNIE